MPPASCSSSASTAVSATPMPSPPPRAAPDNEVVRLQQEALRGAAGGARLSRALHPPRRHLQPPAGRPRRGRRHVPLQGLPPERAGAIPDHDPRARRVHPALPAPRPAKGFHRIRSKNLLSRCIIDIFGRSPNPYPCRHPFAGVRLPESPCDGILSQGVLGQGAWLTSGWLTAGTRLRRTIWLEWSSIIPIWRPTFADLSTRSHRAENPFRPEHVVNGRRAGRLHCGRRVHHQRGSHEPRLGFYRR